VGFLERNAVADLAELLLGRRVERNVDMGPSRDLDADACVLAREKRPSLLLALNYEEALDQFEIRLGHFMGRAIFLPDSHGKVDTVVPIHFLRGRARRLNAGAVQPGALRTKTRLHDALHTQLLFGRVANAWREVILHLGNTRREVFAILRGRFDPIPENVAVHVGLVEELVELEHQAFP